MRYYDIEYRKTPESEDNDGETLWHRDGRKLSEDVTGITIEGLDLGEVDDPPLGLRHRLLRHDERVAVSEYLPGVGDRTKQERGEIVARADAHRERNGDDADHASTAAATPARTAGSFSSVGTTIARIASASRSSASPASSGSSTYAPASGWR